jgi:membrane protease YdiL (CAAX protease family)
VTTAETGIAVQPDAPEPITSWPLRRAIAFVLGVAVLDLLVGRIVRKLAVAGLSPTATSLSLLALFGVLYAVELGIVAWVAHRSGGTMRYAVRLRPPESPARWIAIAAASAFAARIAATAYAAFMLSRGWRLPGWDVDPTRYFPRDTLGWAVLVLIVVVAAPIAEEIVFRGVFLQSLSARVREGWAVALSSVVFALLHLSVFSFLPIVLVAIVFAYLFLRTGSLWV